MLKNIGSTWMLNVLQILAFLVLTPFVVNTLEKPAYGAWGVIMASTMTLQLLAMGIPMATVRYVTSARARGDDEEAEAILGTGVTLSMVLGLVCLVLGIGVFVFTKHLILNSEEWSLSPAEVEDATRALVAMLLLVAGSFTLRLPYALFDAHHDFVVRNIIQAGGLLLRFGLILVLLGSNASLTMLAGITILVPVAEFIVATTVSARRHAPLRYRPGKLHMATAKKLISFGIFAFLINMGTTLAFRMDSLVIGLNLTPVDAADYDIGNKVFENFIGLVITIGTVAMPLATQMEARGEREAVRTIFLKWSKIATTLVYLVGGYLIVMGPEFLHVLFSDDFVPRQGQVLQIITFSFFFFLPVHGMALSVLMGIGKPKVPGIGLLCMGVCNVGLSWILVQNYGIHGVALGTAIPNVLFAIFFLTVSCRQLGVPLKGYLRYVCSRPIVGMLPGLAFLAAMKWGLHAHGWIGVFGSGIVYTAIFGVTQLAYVYKDDPYTDAWQTLKAKLPIG